MSSTAYFNDVAGQWDTMRQGFFSDAIQTKAFALAGLQAGTLAADVGAGTGFMTEGLRRRGVNVIAIDQSEAMLAEMRRKFGETQAIDFRLGTAERLPVDDGAVDYAFANMCLHHVDDPAGAIAEMRRILKPGGTLVITDLDAHRFDFLRTEHHDRWMGFERGDIQQWFEAAGLQNVAVDCVGEHCCAESSCGSEQATISIFAAKGVR